MASLGQSKGPGFFGRARDGLGVRVCGPSNQQAAKQSAQRETDRCCGPGLRLRPPIAHLWPNGRAKPFACEFPARLPASVLLRSRLAFLPHKVGSVQNVAVFLIRERAVFVFPIPDGLPRIPAEVPALAVNASKLAQFVRFHVTG